MPSTSSNIFWLSVSRATGLLILFFAYTQLFSYLGPFGTGQYQFVLSLVTLFGVIIDLGISQYITKRISEDKEKAPHYFRAFLAAEIILALTVYGLMMSYILLRGSETVIIHAGIIAGGGLFFYGLSVPFLSVMSAFQDLKRVAIINFLAPVINTILIFTAIHFHLGIVFLSGHQLAFGITGLILYHQFVRKYIPKPHIFAIFKEIDLPLIKTILKASLPFALLVSFATIYNRIDVILITKILGYHDTGLYTAAYKIVDLANFFPAAVSHSLYPVMSSLMASKSIELVKITLEKYLRFMMMAAMPVGILGTLLAPKLMMIITSNDQRFLPSSDVLAILVWAIVILFIYISANSLVVSQLTKKAVYITAANVVVNIVGNIILLPKYGIKGAAIMTVASESLQGIFYFYFIHKNITKINFWAAFAKPFAAAIIMGVVVFSIKNWQVLGVPLTSGAKALLPLVINVGIVSGVGVIVYLVSLVVFKFFTKDDWIFVKDKFLTRNN